MCSSESNLSVICVEIHMSNIQLVVANDPQEVAVKASQLIAKAIQAKPRPVIGFATGSPPNI